MRGGSWNDVAGPDTCFYVQNAARIIGQRTIDLEVDPPPESTRCVN